jgi:hypothetical protein
MSDHAWMLGHPINLRLCQGSTAPLAKLSAPGAISVATSVHAVWQLRVTLADLRADAPAATELECALKGGRPLTCTIA